MISVIIPVLDEEKALPGCLKHLSRQAAGAEIIVVDGGSRDRTAIIAAEFPVRLLSTPRPGRARQMNHGAAAAGGEWLVFLHADTRLPSRGLEMIGSLDGDHSVQAGCFHQQFSGRHFLLGLISRLHNWRCSRSRIIYGDQCLFIRRAFFAQLGGFPDVAILEDVGLSEKIVQATRPVIFDEAVITDSRKFEQRGILRSFAEVLLIMSCYELGLPIRGRGFFSPVR